ncbi:MAG: permease [Gammaproteobacteria bacterium]|nr:permease [Gammaproteobacteria bacterium]HCP49533.1 ABC transporter permease [Gammaproteobacteria bacterium]
MNVRLILRLVARDWRAGELRLLLAALLVAVGTVSAITLFVDRLHQALLAESTTFLAADRVVSGSQPIPDSFRDGAISQGLALSDTLSFPSMVYAETSAARNQLVSVKAVSETYPLRGTLRIADQPFSTDRPTDSVPDRGEVWLDSRLFPSLGVVLGDSVQVGYEKLRISRVLTSEPDRGGSFFDLGPRVLMRLADVPATRVIQPGSRIGYRLLLAGDESALNEYRDRFREQFIGKFRWQSIRESSPSIGSALDRAESFLLLGGLLAVILAGIAVALSANRYAKRHYDHVSVLKTLGATPNEIQWGYFGVLTVLGVGGVVFGLLLGTGIHLGIVQLLATYLPANLPLPGSRPLLLGAATGFICLIAFALPPLLALKNISPMRAVRRELDVTTTSSLITYGLGTCGGLTLLVWYSNSLWLTFWALAGGCLVCVVFGVMATLLLRAGRLAGMQAGSLWRLALAGLQRRRRENVTQIMIFGLAIMLLLILVLIRTSLLDEWRQQIPENAPNHFVMNVTGTEVDAMQSLLQDHTDYDGKLFPMMRGRIEAVNEVPVRDYQRRSRSEDRGGPRLSSERNLTWTREPPPNNKMISGSWWPSDTQESLVSIEQGYAFGWGLRVGDQLTFDLGGLKVVSKVANIRTVEWDSLRPNFFIIFSEAALADVPATYMTSFYLPPDRKRFLNDILSRYPTITVIEVDELISQVQQIVSRVTQAVELVLVLVLGAGALVLIASIQASRDQRMKEHALIRTLGGSRRLIAGSLASEFSILGLFAGVVAVVGAEITVYALESQVFEMPYQARPWFWLVGPLIGTLIVVTVGYLGTRSLISTPPATILRDL